MADFFSHLDEPKAPRAGSAEKVAFLTAVIGLIVALMQVAGCTPGLPVLFPATASDDLGSLPEECAAREQVARELADKE